VSNSFLSFQVLLYLNEKDKVTFLKNLNKVSDSTSSSRSSMSNKDELLVSKVQVSRHHYHRHHRHHHHHHHHHYHHHCNYV